MKTKNKISLTVRQREGMMRNRCAMSVKTMRKYEQPLRSIMLLVITAKIIKGKLGFSISAADGVFLLRFTTKKAD